MDDLIRVPTVDLGPHTHNPVTVSVRCAKCHCRLEGRVRAATPHAMAVKHDPVLHIEVELCKVCHG